MCVLEHISEHILFGIFKRNRYYRPPLVCVTVCVCVLCVWRGEPRLLRVCVCVCVCALTV